MKSGGSWLWVVLFQLVAAAFIAHRLGVLEHLHNAAHDLGFLHKSACGLLNFTEYVLYSNKVVLPSGVHAAYVHVKRGKIEAVVQQSTWPDMPAVKFMDYSPAVLAPGLIDVHVHMNEPGREDWEGIDTATAAAAAGGLTTLIDMPLNSFPTTTTEELLRQKQAIVRSKARVDVGLWGGLVPENAYKPKVLAAMLEAGALGFKAFMHPSGINDFPHVNATHIQEGMRVAKQYGVPILLHAEAAEYAVEPTGDPHKHSTWLESHPRDMEKAAIRTILRILRKDNGTKWAPGFRLHLVHLSDAEMLPELAQAKAEGLPLTVETCPHYLLFASEDVPDKDTRFKCAPPIREGSNRALLWDGLTDGTIDLLGTDHSPSPGFMKRFQEGDFMRAWGGIAGLQYALPATWHSMATRGLSVSLLSQWWSQAPASMAGLSDSKGSIAQGMDADFVVFRTDELADTTRTALYHKHKETPYANLPLKGRVLATFVRGNQVFEGATGPCEAVCGRLVKKSSRQAWRSTQQSGNGGSEL